ncbi:spore coat protein [Desulfofalx alkaliphila]|uniref:spore coat protein n=1 Tax=Desulfofalx alkaliphila TaxID=105483 RepID=UPI000690DBBE|nr:spore coat protein [Desulfofalx alkaliphila]
MGQTFDQIRDKDLATSMLMDLKYTCECINRKILETSNNQLRQSYINVLTETYNEQKQLFDMMNQRGWYQPTMAQQQEISQASRKINNMQNEIMHTINSSQQQQYYGTSNYQQQRMPQHMPHSGQMY